jgi:hypothetical protein
MSSWNTKRDGYYSSPATAALGHPAAKLEPHSGVTHAVTIPGTCYKAFLDDSYMLPLNGKAPRVEALLKSLSRTTVKGIGKRRTKASPLLQTIEEFQALTTAKAA